MTRSAPAELVAPASSSPSLPASTSASAAGMIPNIQDDSDADNSDGGGLDLDGMIIHEVVADALPPPAHQTSPPTLQDWVEMKDETTGKL